MRRPVVIQLAILFAAASMLCAQTRLQSEDAYVRREGSEWIMGSVSAERRVRLDGGQLHLVSLRNKLTGRECQDATTLPEEIRFSANGEDVTASRWRWKLLGEHAMQASQGTLQLDIELESAGIHVTKHYVIYPGTSVIREWLTLQNSSETSIRISQVAFLHTRLFSTIAQDLQFKYLTGRGNYNGSQLLKSESMTPPYQRTLDSDGGVQPGNYSSFLPLVFLLDRKGTEGVAIGWDYLGHWRFQIGDQDGASLGINLELPGFEKDLRPGASIETPKAFVATFSGEVDELGNQLLDWQYAYLSSRACGPRNFMKTRVGHHMFSMG